MAPATADPLLSVVIAHHVGRRFINRCLASLASTEGVTFETLVVTSDPTYYVPEPMEHYVKAIYVEGGPAHKRNVGVQQTRGEVIVFLDDDILDMSPYTLYNLWRAFKERPNAGMVYARIYNAERRQELDSAGSWLTPSGFLYARESNPSLSYDEITTPVRCLAAKSAGCAVRRDVFHEVGGFDATYGILAEESELSWRVWLRGYEVWWWPDAVMWHAFNTSFKPVADYYTKARIFRNGARNYVAMLLTSLGIARLVWVLPLHLTGWLVAAVGFLCQGRWTNAKYIIIGLLDNLHGLTYTLRKRRQVQQSRVRTDRELMPLISQQPPATYYLQRLQRYWVNQVHG